MEQLLSKDEWVEWFGMSQTKQFLKVLDSLKEDKLYSSVIFLSQGQDANARLAAGAVRCLEEINDTLKNLIHQKESQKDAGK